MSTYLSAQPVFKLAGEGRSARWTLAARRVSRNACNHYSNGQLLPEGVRRAARVNPRRTHQRADPRAAEGVSLRRRRSRPAASQAAAGALAGPPASAAEWSPRARSSGLDAALRRCSHGLLQVPGGRLRREGVDQRGLQGWPQGRGGREGGQPRSHPGDEAAAVHPRGEPRRGG